MISSGFSAVHMSLWMMKKVNQKMLFFPQNLVCDPSPKQNEVRNKLQEKTRRLLATSRQFDSSDQPASRPLSFNSIITSSTVITMTTSWGFLNSWFKETMKFSRRGEPHWINCIKEVSSHLQHFTLRGSQEEKIFHEINTAVSQESKSLNFRWFFMKAGPEIQQRNGFRGQLRYNHILSTTIC